MVESEYKYIATVNIVIYSFSISREKFATDIHPIMDTFLDEYWSSLDNVSLQEHNTSFERKSSVAYNLFSQFVPVQPATIVGVSNQKTGIFSGVVVNQLMINAEFNLTIPLREDIKNFLLPKLKGKGLQDQDILDVTIILLPTS